MSLKASNWRPFFLNNLNLQYLINKLPAMSAYQTLASFGARFFSRAFLFKYGFNLSPMYRRSCGKVVAVSEDLHRIEVKLPLSYKNRNYVNTIFGGSLFASVDPFPMVQLINIIGDDYVVWDKSAEILFLRPGKGTLRAEFVYTPEEIESIISEVGVKNETEIVKTTQLIDDRTKVVCCEVHKKIYIANKAFFKTKRAQSAAKKSL